MTGIVSVDVEPRLGSDSAYSRAIVAGDYVFLHGQTGVDPQTGRLVPGGIVAEAGQILRRFAELLVAAEAEMSQIVKVTCFLRHLEDLDAMNGVFIEWFPNPRPVRTVIGASELHLDAAVEMDAIAYRRAR